MGRLTYQILEQSVLEMFRRIAERHKVVLFLMIFNGWIK